MEEYIDVDKEGLFCTINKKAEKRKQPEIKLAETKKKKVENETPEVKQEPDESSVKNIFQVNSHSVWPDSRPPRFDWLRVPCNKHQMEIHPSLIFVDQ